MKKILLIIPSYKRSNKIQECLDWWKKTTTGNSDVLLVLEESDAENYNHVDTMKLVGDFGNVVKAMNKAVELYPDYEVYGHINDDHHLKTDGWEDRFIDVLKDGGFAYGNDLLQGEKLSTAVFISADTIKKLGYMAVPELEHLFVDNAWMDLGKGINKLFYLDDVIVEHVHPSIGKTKSDERYVAVNSNLSKHQQTYLRWINEKLQGEIKKCLDLK